MKIQIKKEGLRNKETGNLLKIDDVIEVSKERAEAAIKAKKAIAHTENKSMAHQEDCPIIEKKKATAKKKK